MNKLVIMGLIGVPVALMLLDRKRENGITPGKDEPYVPPKPGPTKPVEYVPGSRPFIDSLPRPAKGETRQQQGAKLIKRGQLIRDKVKSTIAANDLDWTSVFSSMGQYSARIPVMADALMIEGVRPNVSFVDQQQIADLLDVYSLTPFVAQLIQQQSAIKALPNLQSQWMAEGVGSFTEKMVEHSIGVDNLKKVATDRYLAGELPKAWPNMPGTNSALYNNPGKYWVNTKQNWVNRRKGANFGWYDPRAPYGVKPFKYWQPATGAHFVGHVDYSQVFRAMGPEITVTDGVSGETFQLTMREALTNPKWAPLVSSEGALQEARHPGIPPYKSIPV